MSTIGRSRYDDELDNFPEFDEARVGFDFDLSDEEDIDELYFFKLFITEELFTDMTEQTNVHVIQYFEKHGHTY